MYTLREDGKREIVYDVFSHVLHLLLSQPEVKFVQTLLRCSLVSRDWANFTIPLLYNSVDLGIGRVSPGVIKTPKEISKAKKILRLLQCNSTYFPYRDFVRNIKVETKLLAPSKNWDKTALEKWMTWL